MEETAAFKVPILVGVSKLAAADLGRGFARNSKIFAVTLRGWTTVDATPYFVVLGNTSHGSRERNSHYRANVIRSIGDRTLYGWDGSSCISNPQFGLLRSRRFSAWLLVSWNMHCGDHYSVRKAQDRHIEAASYRFGSGSPNHFGRYTLSNHCCP